MNYLNKMRLLSGIPIDPSIEITEKKEVVVEARTAPLRTSELTPANAKTISKGVIGLQSAVKHIEQAIKSLEKIPSIDYNAVVPRYITELEDILNDGTSSMKEHLKLCTAAAKKAAKAEAEETLSEEISAEELEIDEAELESFLNQGNDDDSLDESMNFYTNMNKDYEDDPSKPVNVSDGSSNSEQVWDDPMDPKNAKDESPMQLHTGDEKSEQDQSNGNDLENPFKTPASIISSLKSAIAEIKAESKKLGASNKESSYFYTDIANAFEELLGCMEKGTLHHFKKAQIHAQSLMGPMLHKIPTDVWKFLANGGATRSLKDYMKPVKDPITGPRNTIK